VAQKEVTIYLQSSVIHSIRSNPGKPHFVSPRERERRDRSDHAHRLNATNWEFAWQRESGRCRARFSRGMGRTVPLEILSANLSATSIRRDKESRGKRRGKRLSS